MEIWRKIQMSNVESEEFVIPDSPYIPDRLLPIDDLQYICRKSSISDFNVIVESSKYNHLLQIRSDLQARAELIELQLGSRTGEASWRHKASDALSVMKHKHKIVSNRIDRVRNNHFDSIKRMFGINGILDSRLLMIKVLIHIIDNSCNVARLGDEERSVLDSARKVGGVSSEVKFSKFSFNLIRNSITTLDGVDIAMMTSAGFVDQEIGGLLGSSGDLYDIIRRMLPVLHRYSSTEECKADGHDSSSCLRCNSAAIYADATDIIADI
jgi:hypothetical protein